MMAYKLLRRKKDGSLGPLFVGRASRLSFGVTYEARSDLPHPGLAHDLVLQPLHQRPRLASRVGTHLEGRDPCLHRLPLPRRALAAGGA